MQVLVCQHECVRELATRPGRLSPIENFLPLHYDYLQFAYYQGKAWIIPEDLWVGGCSLLQTLPCRGFALCIPQFSVEAMEVYVFPLSSHVSAAQDGITEGETTSAECCHDAWKDMLTDPIYFF